jgi:hypothetical protein
MTMARIILGMILAASLAACGGATSGHTSSSPAPGHSASAAHVRTYPEQKADMALCTTYNSDIANGDTFDIGQALQQAQGTVSPKLANDVGVVVNENGTLQQDEQNQVYVAFDCALAKNGVRPH